MAIVFFNPCASTINLKHPALNNAIMYQANNSGNRGTSVNKVDHHDNLDIQLGNHAHELPAFTLLCNAHSHALEKFPNQINRFYILSCSVHKHQLWVFTMDKAGSNKKLTALQSLCYVNRVKNRIWKSSSVNRLLVSTRCMCLSTFGSQYLRLVSRNGTHLPTPKPSRYPGRSHSSFACGKHRLSKST